MIILPLTPDPEPTPTPLTRKSAEVTEVKVLVLGFSPAERKLLEGAVALSQRRSTRITVVPFADHEQAHVVLIDTQNSDALAWAAVQPSLQEKAVIWVDANAVSDIHIAVRRPVPWPSLTTLLQQAIDRSLEHRLASVRGGLLSRPMSVF